VPNTLTDAILESDRNCHPLLISEVIYLLPSQILKLAGVISEVPNAPNSKFSGAESPGPCRGAYTVLRKPLADGEGLAVVAAY